MSLINQKLNKLGLVAKLNVTKSGISFYRKTDNAKISEISGYELAMIYPRNERNTWDVIKYRLNNGR